MNNDAHLFSGQKTSFMLFLNKFDIFEKKVLNVRTIQMSTLCHRWSVLSFQFNTLHCAGSAQCMWVVQRLPASFNRETRDWTCVRVSIFFIPQGYGLKGVADGKVVGSGYWLVKAFQIQHYILIVSEYRFQVLDDEVFHNLNYWFTWINHVCRFVKKKFEELYFQSTAPDCVDRVFKIYQATALDQKLVKKTFKLVDETLRRRNLFEAGLLWPCLQQYVCLRGMTFLHWEIKRSSDFVGYTRGQVYNNIKSICWFYAK